MIIDSDSILASSISIPKPISLGISMNPFFGLTGVFKKNWWISFHLTKYSWYGVWTGDWVSEKFIPALDECPWGIVIKSCIVA